MEPPRGPRRSGAERAVRLRASETRAFVLLAAELPNTFPDLRPYGVHPGNYHSRRGILYRAVFYIRQLRHMYFQILETLRQESDAGPAPALPPLPPDPPVPEHEV